MRRLPVFLLLMLVFAVVLTGCGGEESQRLRPRWSTSWSQAINAGDDEAAAELFAPARS